MRDYPALVPSAAPISKKIVFFGVVVLCLAFAGWLHATDANQAGTQAGIFDIRANFANWVAQGALWGGGLIIMALWVSLVWVTAKLYGSIGSYLLPIWDITSSKSATFMGSPLPGYMCINSQWASVVTSFGHVFYVLAAVLVFVIVAADTLKLALSNEDGTRVFAGFGYSFFALMLFPYLYTGVLLLANIAAQLVQNATTATFHNTPTTLLNALSNASLFTSMDTATRAKLGVAGTTATGATVMPSGDALWNMLTVKTGNAWNEAAGYVFQSIETFISRIVEIILCVMALLEILALFMLKGAQFAGLIINYFLGIIACAFLASPATRPYFFKWLRAFIELAFWGFVWGILLYSTWLIANLASDLRGFDGTVVGTFLFPFLIFGTLKKFREVAGIVGGFAVTGAIAAGVGLAMEKGFNSHAGGTAKIGGAAMDKGASWGAQAIGAVTDKASYAAMAIPGANAGVAAAKGIQYAGAAAKAVMHTQGAMGQAFGGMANPKGKGPQDSYKPQPGIAGAGPAPAAKMSHAAKAVNAFTSVPNKVAAQKQDHQDERARRSRTGPDKYDGPVDGRKW